MAKIKPPDEQELMQEMSKDDSTTITLSPHAFYAVLMTLYAGRLSLTIDTGKGISFDEWLSGLQKLFDAKFPKTGEFIKYAKETMQQNSKSHLID